MDKRTLQKKLNQPYNTENWKEIVQFVFPNVQLWGPPPTIPVDEQDKEVVDNIIQLGTVKLNDGKTLAILELKLKKNVNLIRNRVRVNNVVSKYIDLERTHGVLSVFEQGQDDYRFTFSAKAAEFDKEEGDFAVRRTDTKRYTYVLGKHESCRTPAERFFSLAEKKEVADIKAIQDAFSVEKLSKEFFNGYKERYLNFVQHITGKRPKKVNNKWEDQVMHPPHAMLQYIFNGNEKEVRDFVKLMLGRLVFIHFVQKKRWLGVPVTETGWENGDPNFLYNAFQQFEHKELFYSHFLELLFHEGLNTPGRTGDIFEVTGTKVPYLNGGLFDTGEVDISNVIFPAVLFEDLLEFFTCFNFTIDESDLSEREVGIDPEMLGHIFENLLEDNKDKGAFYTPKDIVHYMCRESLKEYLRTQLEEQQLWPTDDTRAAQMQEALDAFIQRKEAGRLIEFDKAIATALRDVKICDPAIGSGAFPMGLLNEIYHCMYTLYHASPDVVGHVWGMESWEPDTVKKNIIQNSIYGVDIEKGAVDIARLRFWLSLLIEEENPNPLPNLDYKIVVGNSLVSKLGDEIIDIDWSLNEISHGLFGNEFELRKIELLQKISREQREYFNPESDKKKLSDEIRKLKIDLLINQLGLMVTTKGVEKLQNGELADKRAKKSRVGQTEIFLKTQGWKNCINQLKKLKEKPDQPLQFFDWKLDFPEVLNEFINPNPGFDIVIGNPPYVQMQKNGGYLANELKNANFSTFERTGDVYSIFYELGFRLLKKKGIHTFITSSQWMKAHYGISLRMLFISKNPLILIALGPGVFESAVVDTNILIAKNEKNQKQLKGTVIKKATELKKIFSLACIEMPYVSEEKWVILDGDKQRLSKKLNSKGKILKDWSIKIFRGLLTGYNEAFVIDSERRDLLIKADPMSSVLIKPILRGREIDKFVSFWSGEYIIATFPALKVNIDNYWAIKKYLEEFQPKLNQTGEKFINKEGKEEKSRKKTNNKWFEIQDQIGYYNEFSKERIIWKRIGSILRFSYSDIEIYSLDSTCIATGEKIKYLTALLNSKLCNYLLFETAPRTGMGDLIISVQALEPLPVLYPNENQERQIVEVFEKIIEYKKGAQDTTALELQINYSIYHFYELAYEEVKVIDPEFPLSRKEYENITLEE